MSASVELICVNPAKIEQYWPLASGWIKKAFDKNIGDSSFEETRGLVFGGHALLWLIIEDGRESVGAVVTHVIQEPTKKLCIIRALGGRGMMRWRHLISEIEKYAAHQSCHALRIYGRVGWKKIYPNYEQPWIALERKL